MFTSMTARVSTNTYCLAGTRRFSRRCENSVGRVTHKREAPTDTVQLVSIQFQHYIPSTSKLLFFLLPGGTVGGNVAVNPESSRHGMHV